MSEVKMVANNGSGWAFVETPESANARMQEQITAVAAVLEAAQAQIGILGKERAALTAERDSVKRSNETLKLAMKLAQQTREEIDAVFAQRDQLRAALEAVEWAVELGDEHGHHHPACHRCRRFQSEGHSPNCIVGLALKGKA